MQVTNNNFETTRGQEMRCFLLLTCVAAPVLAVAFKRLWVSRLDVAVDQRPRDWLLTAG